MLEEEIPLHFTQEEVAILANCVGKTIAKTTTEPLLVETGYMAIEFTDGTAISLSNFVEDLFYDFYEDTNGYELAGNFRLTDTINEPFSSYPTNDIPEDVLPVTRTIRRAYVVNETFAYSGERPGEKRKSFIHTQGIVFMFWDETDPDIETPYYFYAHQQHWMFDSLATGITQNEKECVNYNFKRWGKPDIYSVSMIRVG